MRLIILILLLVVSLEAQNKIALLIGNSEYKGGNYLKNPLNDIDLLEERLTSIGFTVTKLPNGSRSEIIKALKKFNRKIDGSTITLIYFSGHGVHSTLDDKNYLIPIGAFNSLISEAHLSDLAISDNYLLGSLSGAKVSILLLDACRSNDFMKTKGKSKGLGLPNTSLGNDYVISYATEVGKTANDGNTNSPYAKALYDNLNKKLSLADIFTKVRAEVRKATHGEQKPYFEPHFENIIYLNLKHPLTKVEKLQEKCDKDNSKSCTNLGYIYDKGNGVSKDYAKAINFYKKGCNLGNVGLIAICLSRNMELQKIIR